MAEMYANVQRKINLPISQLPKHKTQVERSEEFFTNLGIEIPSTWKLSISWQNRAYWFVVFGI